MVLYTNGKVYKLVCTLPDVHDIYVGATCSNLWRRESEHRWEANGTRCNSKVYRFMREYGSRNFKIELIENYPCTSKKELGVREQHWIEELKPALNTYCGSNRKEVLRRYNNKPERKAHMKRYYQKNKHRWDKYKRTRELKVANVELI